MSRLNKISNIILSKYSNILVVFLLFIIGFSLYFSKNFYLDASADSLSLKNDKDLAYYREIKNKFVSDDYLIFNLCTCC